MLNRPADAARFAAWRRGIVEQRIAQIVTTKTTQPIRRKNPLCRAVELVTTPIYARLKQEYLIRKWSQHADPRVLDWDWTATNYNRVALINLLLSRYANPAYLEIGCATNALFDALPVRNKIGVDPVSGGTLRLTSDEFFQQNRARFDVVFIDGLHTYDQVRRDVVNSIQCLREDGWIVLHDLLPRSWIEAHVPMVTRGEWTGDVWKVAFELAQTEGMDFRILKIDHGVGVLRLRKPAVSLTDRTGELRDARFAYYYDNLKFLPIVSWEEAQPWLTAGA